MTSHLLPLHLVSPPTAHYLATAATIDSTSSLLPLSLTPLPHHFLPIDSPLSHGSHHAHVTAHPHALVISLPSQSFTIDLTPLSPRFSHIIALHVTQDKLIAVDEYGSIFLLPLAPHHAQCIPSSYSHPIPPPSVSSRSLLLLMEGHLHHISFHTGINTNWSLSHRDRKSLGIILSEAKSTLVGRGQVTPPAVAVTHAEEGGVTVHEDGSVRIWRHGGVKRVGMLDGLELESDLKIAVSVHGDEYTVAILANGLYVMKEGEVREFAVPEGEVVDVAWGVEGELVVLMRESLVVYREDGPVLIPVRQEWGVTAEEELERYIVQTEGDVARVEADVECAGVKAVLQPWGRLAPTMHAVQRALSSLGVIDRDDVIRGPVDIVSAMRAWKGRELHPQRENAIVPLTTDDSIYTAFAMKPAEDADDMSDASLLPANIKSVDRTLKLRWIKLLLELRKHEYQENEVVCLSSTPDSILLVHTNMVSLISYPSTPKDGLTARLDHLSLVVLEFAESHHRRALHSVEAMLYDVASKAYALVSRWRGMGLNVELVHRVERLGTSVLTGLELSEEQMDLLEILSGSGGEDITREWLDLGSFVLPESPSENSHIGAEGALSAAGRIISAQFESMRRLNLARLILIASSATAPSAVQNAIRGALFCTALSWAIHQKSRLNPGRTAVEEEFLRIATESNAGSAPFLAREFLAAIIRVYPNGEGNIHSNILSSREPRVALRILAPLVEYSSSVHPQAITTAECLLVEASLAVGAESRLWELASTLLLEDVPLDSDSEFHRVLEVLLRGADGLESRDQPPEEKLRVLNAILLVGDNRGGLSEYTLCEEDLRRMFAMPTVETLLVLASSAPDVTNHGLVKWLHSQISRVTSVSSLGLYHCVKFMLKVSKLMFRVERLQCHLDLMVEPPLEASSENATLQRPRHGSASKNIACSVTFRAIHDAISAIRSNLPISLSRIMPEFATLWSMAFQTAMNGNLWDEALLSCISNPVDTNQKHHFQTLVLGMVHANALGKLVVMSMTVIGSVIPNSDKLDITDEEIPTRVGFDIFDAAAKIIEEAALEQARFIPRTASENEAKWKDGPDFWGALYALHASRGNWKEAAIAMDTCGKVTSQAVCSDSTSMTSIISKSTSKIIMDRICLSATACAHAISLVDKPSSRYILPNTNNSRGLLTDKDIESRAIRAVALRAFSMDEYAPDSLVSILKATTPETIDIMARLGYYDHAIAIAERLSMDKTKPGGENRLDHWLKHILSNYLVPAATKRVGTSSQEEGDEIQSREKMAQIRMSSSACSTSTSTPIEKITMGVNSKSFMSNKFCDEACQVDMAMSLLRQYTTVYSTKYNGLGLHVAHSILTGQGLPQWLKELCLSGNPSDSENSGAFASSGCDRGIADPAGLARLLMKHHRYEDACDAVTSVLSKHNERIATTSLRRLPEKGDIMYVPYDVIDTIWYAMDRSIELMVASSTDGNVVSVMKSRQSRLGEALETHFELLRLSEEGLRSARALAN